MFDPEQDMRLRRTAIALASQLPDDLDAARRVLDHARALLDDFLDDRGDTRPATPERDGTILFLVRRSEQEA